MKFIYLKESYKVREQEKKGEGERERIFHLLAHSKNDHTDQNQDLLRVSHTGDM